MQRTVLFKQLDFYRLEWFFKRESLFKPYKRVHTIALEAHLLFNSDTIALHSVPAPALSMFFSAAMEGK